MKTPNLVTLQNNEGDTNDMYWQSDKNDFVTYENWKMELHDRLDYSNAIFKFDEEKYYGEVCFEHSEITAMEMQIEEEEEYPTLDELIESGQKLNSGQCNDCGEKIYWYGTDENQYHTNCAVWKINKTNTK